MTNVIDRLSAPLGVSQNLDFNLFMASLEHDANEDNIKMTAKRQTLLKTALAGPNKKAEPVLNEIYKPGKVEVNPIFGQFMLNSDSSTIIVEYGPDTSLRDTEQVPLLEEGCIEAFFRGEVLPHVPDAWIDSTNTQIGYEISFTRHFDKAAQLRSLNEIRDDLTALPNKADWLLDLIVGAERQG